MTTNTKVAQERTASIDLAQLDKLTRWTFDGGMTAEVSKNGQWVAFKDLEVLARRSLTSGAPAEPVAEVIEEPAFPGSGITVRGVRFIDSTARPGDKLYRTAPVRGAAATSDTRALCMLIAEAAHRNATGGKAMPADQIRAIVDEVLTGAAAKTEHNHKED